MSCYNNCPENIKNLALVPPMDLDSLLGVNGRQEDPAEIEKEKQLRTYSHALRYPDSQLNSSVYNYNPNPQAQFYQAVWGTFLLLGKEAGYNFVLEQLKDHLENFQKINHQKTANFLFFAGSWSKEISLQQIEKTQNPAELRFFMTVYALHATDDELSRLIAQQWNSQDPQVADADYKNFLLLLAGNNIASPFVLKNLIDKKFDAYFHHKKDDPSHRNGAYSLFAIQCFRKGVPLSEKTLLKLFGQKPTEEEHNLALDCWRQSSSTRKQEYLKKIIQWGRRNRWYSSKYWTNELFLSQCVSVEDFDPNKIEELVDLFTFPNSFSNIEEGKEFGIKKAKQELLLAKNNAIKIKVLESLLEKTEISSDTWDLFYSPDEAVLPLLEKRLRKENLLPDNHIKKFNRCLLEIAIKKNKREDYAQNVQKLWEMIPRNFEIDSHWPYYLNQREIQDILYSKLKADLIKDKDLLLMNDQEAANFLALGFVQKRIDFIKTIALKKNFILPVTKFPYSFFNQMPEQKKFFTELTSFIQAKHETNDTVRNITAQMTANYANTFRSLEKNPEKLIVLLPFMNFTLKKDKRFLFASLSWLETFGDQGSLNLLRKELVEYQKETVISNEHLQLLRAVSVIKSRLNKKKNSQNSQT